MPMLILMHIPCFVLLLDADFRASPCSLTIRCLPSLRQIRGAGDCREFSFCNRHGTCSGGVCTCDPGWRGKACESYTLKSPTYDEEVPPLMPHSAPRDSQLALKPSFSTPYSAPPALNSPLRPHCQ